MPKPPVNAADVGPSVNYARIDDAIAAHQQALVAVDNLSAMQALLEADAKAFLSIEGSTGSPLVITTDEANALISTALFEAMATAASLGEALNALSMGLPIK